MKRIATANRAVDLFSVGKDGFRAAVPGVSDATYLSALQFNHMQEAIVRTIEQAGLALSDTDFDQFVTALNTIYPRLSSAAFTASPTGPTPAQFDATNKLATMAAVQRALGNYQGVSAFLTSGTFTLTAANAGQEIILSGSSVTAALVLPLLSSVPDGAAFLVKSEASTSNWTINANAADGAAIISTSSGVASLPIKRGDFALIVKSGLFWRVHGTVDLGSGDSFAASLSINGYQKLPSGLILQWGQVLFAAAGGNQQAVTFPIAFPNGVRMVSASNNSSAGAGGSANYPVVSAIAVSNTSVIIQQVTSTAVAAYASWFAIGN
ncbi:hypothetical protein BA896_021775 [Janthinobacterium lividum]|uniref:Putative tail fiber protein gp53-like C-terminal domain-containing protein n=1 Tax=Janthinobacterium lividum TaxID=29581 RepID=A0A1E8PJ90_9BURK|nr:hypothetical protein BA896_021775 [Janthinobacterium lividum]